MQAHPVIGCRRTGYGAIANDPKYSSQLIVVAPTSKHNVVVTSEAGHVC